MEHRKGSCKEMNLYILEQRWVTDSLPCPDTVYALKHLGRSEEARAFQAWGDIGDSLLQS